MPANWVVVVLVVVHKLLLSIFVRFWILVSSLFCWLFVLANYASLSVSLQVSCSTNYAYAALAVPKLAHISSHEQKGLCVEYFFDLFLYFFLYYLCCCVLVCVWGICCSAVECTPATARTTATRVSDKKRPHRILDCTEPPQATTELCVCLPVGIADALSLSLSHSLLHTHKCSYAEMYNERAARGRGGCSGGPSTKRKLLN